MRNLFHRLQVRRKERGSFPHQQAVVAEEDAMGTKQKTSRKRRWSKRGGQWRRNPEDHAVMVLPESSVTMETTRDASSSLVSVIGNAKEERSNPEEGTPSRKEIIIGSKNEQDDSDGCHRFDDEDGDDDSTSSAIHHFEVDYRGHYVEKDSSRDTIVQLALDASANVAPSSSSTTGQRTIGSRGAKKDATSLSSQLDKKGNDLFEEGKLNQALSKYEEALKMKRQSLLGQYNALQKQQDGMSEEERASVLASMAISINNLTYLRQVQGQSSAQETLASYETALQIKRDILGPEHISVAKTLNNIGSVYYTQRNYNQAAESYEQARDILKLNLGETHLDICTVTSNLGDVHFCLQQWKRAVAEYRAALQLRWRLLGPTDPKVVRLMEQIAELEMKINQSGADDGAESSDGEDDSMEFEALHAEVHQELQRLDQLQKKASLDIIKDKTRVFRELRELREEKLAKWQVPPLEHGSTSNSPSKVSLHPSMRDHAADICGKRSLGDRHSSGHESPLQLVPSADVSEVPDTPTRTNEKECPTVQSPSPGRRSSVVSPRLTPEQRLEALSSVKTRLAKLRASREGTLPSCPVSPARSPVKQTTACGEKKQTETVAAPSLLSPSRLLKTSELLAIKQGIHSLRGSSACAAPLSNANSTSFIEASSLARLSQKSRLLAEKRRSVAQRMALAHPTHFE